MLLIFMSFYHAAILQHFNLKCTIIGETDGVLLLLSRAQRAIALPVRAVRKI